MCNQANSTLTLASMLRDPLIRMVMRSDGVTEADFSALMTRTKMTLEARIIVQNTIRLPDGRAGAARLTASC